MQSDKNVQLHAKKMNFRISSADMVFQETFFEGMNEAVSEAMQLSRQNEGITFTVEDISDPAQILTIGEAIDGSWMPGRRNIG